LTPICSEWNSGIYRDPRGYAIIPKPGGSTRALLTLAPSQVRRLSPTDVLTTRQMALAA
jgi:hypothetical protein